VAISSRFEQKLARFLARIVTNCSHFHGKRAGCEFKYLSRFEISAGVNLRDPNRRGTCGPSSWETASSNQAAGLLCISGSLRLFMSFGGIYIAPRGLITLSAEVIWLALSTMVLVAINCTSMQEPLSATLVLNQTAAVVMVYVAIFFLMDLYSPDLVTAGRALLLNLDQAAGLVCVAIGVLGFLTPLLRFSPALIFSHILLTALFVVCARAVIDRVDHPLVEIGVVAGERACQKFNVENGQRRDLGLSFDRIGKTIEEAAAALNATDEHSSMRTLVIDPDILDDPRANEFLETCRKRHIKTENLRNFVERAQGKVIFEPDLSRDLAASRGVSVPRIEYAMRRSRDIILASLVLVLTMPISLLIMLVIRCESEGSVFFTQKRIGQNGRPFTMLKFRSMFQDVAVEGDCAWTTHEADPRVTRVGAIVRKLHLDELPQLINVIRGEMGLVGPRPFHPLQVEELESKMPYFGLRHLVKPGITGWAQIRCDYAASIENRGEVLARDLYYVKHASFLLDLLIMLDTIRICVWQKGAR
jgi:exopolysaccharide biosynthesis polyprenyl glycosylphosphotransferase